MDENSALTRETTVNLDRFLNDEEEEPNQEEIRKENSGLKSIIERPLSSQSNKPICRICLCE